MSPLPDGAGLAVMGSLPIRVDHGEILLLEVPPTTADGRRGVGPRHCCRRFATRGACTPSTSTSRSARRTSRARWDLGAHVQGRRRGDERAQLGFGMVDPAVRDAKFVAYVGHDTNIWNLAACSTCRGCRRVPTQPDAARRALMFEVRELPTRSSRCTRATSRSRSEQMRNATPLTGDALPQRTPLRLPGCSSTQPGFPCTIEEFAVARAQLARQGLRGLTVRRRHDGYPWRLHGVASSRRTSSTPTPRRRRA
jgi:hypothetical protein